MIRETDQHLQSDILEEDVELSIAELCRASGLSAEDILHMVDYGIIEPLRKPPATRLAASRFRGVSVQRVLCANRLQRDLGVNLAGAALALDLLEELRLLRARLRRFE